MNGAILQQVFVVEFVIQAQMCEDCHRVEAKDFWKAVVQVRQKVHAGDTCLEQSADQIFNQMISCVELNVWYELKLLVIYCTIC